jgi:hypothetical protein
MVRAFLAVLIVCGSSALGSALLAQQSPPQFQVDPFWPKTLPNEWILGQVSGVAVDKRGHVWVVQRPRSLSERELGAQQSPPYSRCCRAAPPVLVFDPSGNLVRFWGGPGPLYQWPESEHGIYVDDDDNVWLAGNGEKDAQVLKFTLDGRFLLQIGRSGQSKGSNDTANLGSPADLRVDLAARELYVADGYRNRRIVVFDSQTGAYKRHTARRRVTRPRPRTTRPGPRPRSSATRCTASGSRATGWCMCATGPTTVSRCFAKMARSCPRPSSSARRG